MELYESNLKIKKIDNGREGYAPNFRKKFALNQSEAEAYFLKLKPILEKLNNKEIDFNEFTKIYKIMVLLD